MCRLQTYYRHREAFQASGGEKRGDRGCFTCFEVLPNPRTSGGNCVCYMRPWGVMTSLPDHSRLSSACRGPGVPSPVRTDGTSTAKTASPATASAPPVLVPPRSSYLPLQLSFGFRLSVFIHQSCTPFGNFFLSQTYFSSFTEAWLTKIIYFKMSM